MDLEIKRAFKAPFSEKKWYLKIIFPSIMAILGFILNSTLHYNKMEAIILWSIIFLPGIALNGFFLQFEHNVIHDATPLLPELKSKIIQYFRYGFYFLGVLLIYLILLIIFAFIFGLTFGLFSGIVSIFLGFNKLLVSLISLIIYIPFTIFMVVFWTLAQAKFADNFSFEEALDYKKICHLIPTVKFELLVYMLLFVGFIVIFFIINSIFALVKFIIIFAPVIAIIQLMMINVKAQIYKIAKYRLENLDS